MEFSQHGVSLSPCDPTKSLPDLCVVLWLHVSSQPRTIHCGYWNDVLGSAGDWAGKLSVFRE